MKTVKFFILALAVSTLWLGCDKSDSSDTTRVSVRLTDAPGDYQEVNVDITGVEFKMDGQLVNLDVTTGVYNLLDFVNGLDTLLASEEVESGTLSQVRLILGDNNTVMVDGVVYQLATPSAQQSGLKLNMNSELTPGVDYDLLLDFDASKSIVRTGNGKYQLKPVLRAIHEATTGSIQGSVSTSLSLPAVVTVSNGTVIFTSSTDANGNFLVRGLEPGAYTVTITPVLPLQPVTLTNVNVTVGAKTEIPALALGS